MDQNSSDTLPSSIWDSFNLSNLKLEFTKNLQCEILPPIICAVQDPISKTILFCLQDGSFHVLHSNPNYTPPTIPSLPCTPHSLFLRPNTGNLLALSHSRTELFLLEDWSTSNHSEATWKSLTLPPGPITCLDWCSGLPWLYLGCKLGKLGVIHLFNSATKPPYFIPCLATRPFASVIAVHLHPCQPELLLLVYQDGTIIVWHLLESKRHLKYTSPDWTSYLPSYTLLIHATSATWSPDGSHLIVMYDQGWLSLWNLKSEDPLAVFSISTNDDILATPSTQLSWFPYCLNEIETTSLYLEISSLSSPSSQHSEKNVFRILLPKSPKHYSQLTKKKNTPLSLDKVQFQLHPHQGLLQCSLILYEPLHEKGNLPTTLLLISNSNHLVAYDLRNPSLPLLQLPSFFELSENVGSFVQSISINLNKQDFEALWSLNQQIKPKNTVFLLPELEPPQWPCSLVLLVFSKGIKCVLVSLNKPQLYCLIHFSIYFELVKEVIVDHLPDSLLNNPTLMVKWHSQFDVASIHVDLENLNIFWMATNGTLVRFQAINFLVKEKKGDTLMWKSLMPDNFDLFHPLTYTVEKETKFESLLFRPISVFFNVPSCASLFQSMLTVVDYDAWHFFDFKENKYQMIQPGQVALFIKHINQKEVMVGTKDTLGVWNTKTHLFSPIKFSLPIIHSNVHQGHWIVLNSKELNVFHSLECVGKFKLKQGLGFTFTQDLVLAWNSQRIYLLRFPQLKELSSFPWKSSLPISLIMMGPYLLNYHSTFIQLESYLPATSSHKDTLHSTNIPNSVPTALPSTSSFTNSLPPTSSHATALAKIFDGAELRHQMAERGERLERLEMKFSELSNTASNFAEMAKKLNAKSNSSSKWKFF